MVALAKCHSLAEKLDKLLPTDRQAEMLAFILHSPHQPTMRQMAVHCGVSLGTARNDMLALRRQGWVDWAPTESRTVQVAKGILFAGDVQ